MQPESDDLRCLQNIAPRYLVDYCIPVSDVASRQTSEICQSTLPYCSAVSMKHVWPSGLRCWGSDGLELITGQSPDLIRRSAAVALGAA